MAEVAQAVEATIVGRGVSVDLGQASTTEKRAEISGVLEPGQKYRRQTPAHSPAPSAPSEFVAGRETVVREGAVTDAPTPPEPDAAQPTKTRMWMAALAALVGVMGVIVAVTLGGGDDARPSETTVRSGPVVENPGVPSANTLDPVTAVAGVIDGRVGVFSWAHDDDREVVFRVSRVDGDGTDPEIVEVPQFTTGRLGPDEVPCVTVQAIIVGEVSSETVGPVCAQK
jgi:hypothetical protein